MRKIAEVVGRLYKEGKITKRQLDDRLAKGTITEEEYRQIVGE